MKWFLSGFLCVLASSSAFGAESRILEILEKRLAGASQKNQLAIITSLRYLGDPAAVPLLRKHLQSKSPVVQCEAAMSLLWLGVDEKEIRATVTFGIVNHRICGLFGLSYELPRPKSIDGFKCSEEMMSAMGDAINGASDPQYSQCALMNYYYQNGKADRIAKGLVNIVRKTAAARSYDHSSCIAVAMLAKITDKKLAISVIERAMADGMLVTVCALSLLNQSSEHESAIVALQDEMLAGSRTDYSYVFLHGFVEITPVIRDIMTPMLREIIFAEEQQVHAKIEAIRHLDLFAKQDRDYLDFLRRVKEQPLDALKLEAMMLISKHERLEMHELSALAARILDGNEHGDYFTIDKLLHFLNSYDKMPDAIVVKMKHVMHNADFKNAKAVAVLLFAKTKQKEHYDYLMSVMKDDEYIFELELRSAKREGRRHVVELMRSMKLDPSPFREQLLNMVENDHPSIVLPVIMLLNSQGVTRSGQP